MRPNRNNKCFKHSPAIAVTLLHNDNLTFNLFLLINQRALDAGHIYAIKLLLFHN
jgi:hypothetical protein